mmetsp:Transcript_99894/g.161043  ORF Transcript_99894/g.161043 Transcript_99894/m.161043 type:complete len:124 (-) Transcript_99894:96-467(-)
MIGATLHQDRNKAALTEFAFVAAHKQSHFLRFKLFQACSSHIAHNANTDRVLSIAGKSPEYPARENVHQQPISRKSLVNLFGCSLSFWGFFLFFWSNFWSRYFWGTFSAPMISRVYRWALRSR